MKIPFLDAVPDKYKALLIFIIFTTNNGFAWLMFDPVAGWLEENVKGLNRTQLELLSSWQPAVFICMCIPIMKLVTRFDGLRFCIRIGATSEMLGSVLKLIGALSRKSVFGLVMIHIGQIFSGVGSPVATGCVSALSATWFEPEERTRATAAAVLFNTVGNALCYLFVPSLTHALSFAGVTGYEVIMAFIAVSLAWIALPEEVRADHSANEEGKNSKNEGATDGSNTGETVIAEEEQSEPLFPQIKQLFKNPSIVCMLLIYAWLCGGFAAWISLFAATYNAFYTEFFIGFMCFFGMAAYVVGGLISSMVVDLWFTRQMKYVIFFCVTMTTLANLVFICCTPNDKGYCLWNLGKGFILFSTAMCGFWNGAAAPLFYELVAEISFPVEEGVSGICVSIFENAGALIFYQVVSKFFQGQSMSVAYSFGMTVCVALSAAVKQRYNRTYYNYISDNNPKKEAENAE